MRHVKYLLAFLLILGGIASCSQHRKQIAQTGRATTTIHYTALSESKPIPFQLGTPTTSSTTTTTTTTTVPVTVTTSPTTSTTTEVEVSSNVWGDPYSLATWDSLAGCESNGNWQINTGNGYYGGIQFALGSWQLVGGTGYPHEHSKEEQIKRGQLLYEKQGWGAWPHCSRELGFR